MFKIVDRGLGVLLILGAAGHTFGSIRTYGREPMTLLWALSATLFILLLAAVHLLRTARPGDHALAWIGVVAALCQVFAAVVFGELSGDPADPRVIGFVVICLGLAGFGFRYALIKGAIA